MNQQLRSEQIRLLKTGLVFLGLFFSGVVSAQQFAPTDGQSSDKGGVVPTTGSAQIPSVEKITVGVQGGAVIHGKGFDASKVEVQNQNNPTNEKLNNKKKSEKKATERKRLS